LAVLDVVAAESMVGDTLSEVVVVLLRVPECWLECELVVTIVEDVEVKLAEPTAEDVRDTNAMLGAQNACVLVLVLQTWSAWQQSWP
jgi:hypothetical protein